MIAMSAVPQPLVALEVKRHPRGGWTLAVPVDAARSSARLYRGWWPRRAAARRALGTKFS